MFNNKTLCQHVTEELLKTSLRTTVFRGKFSQFCGPVCQIPSDTSANFPRRAWMTVTYFAAQARTVINFLWPPKPDQNMPYMSLYHHSGQNSTKFCNKKLNYCCDRRMNKNVNECQNRARRVQWGRLVPCRVERRTSVHIISAFNGNNNNIQRISSPPP